MGDFFELFGLKRIESAFSRNCCAVNITTEVWPPPPQAMSGPMGELRRAVVRILVVFFLMYP
jgi:hypothetical protein